MKFMTNIAKEFSKIGNELNDEYKRFGTGWSEVDIFLHPDWHTHVDHPNHRLTMFTTETYLVRGNV